MDNGSKHIILIHICYSHYTYSCFYAFNFKVVLFKTIQNYQINLGIFLISFKYTLKWKSFEIDFLFDVNINNN